MKDAPHRYGRAGNLVVGWAGQCAAAFFLVFIISVGSLARGAQIPDPPLPVDPRPLTQLISAEEKSWLIETNPKKLIEAYLRISDIHLQAAFSLIRVNNHGASERELDVYNKAVAAAGKEAFGLQDGKRAVSKRIEQALYRQIKTLETIDRMFPAEREMFADSALKRAKQLRLQALNEAFASGDVLKDPDEEKKPKSESPPPKEAPPKNQDLPRPIARAASLQRFVGLRQTSDRPASNHLAVLPARVGSGRSGFQMIKGDYLTEEEDDHVREAQAPDARTKVFMKIADRRLKAILGPSGAPVEKKDQKKIEEEEKEWGALPKLSRAEFLRHYARAISECMAKLEDAYERNPKASALPKALALLRDATDKHLAALRALKADLTNENEASAISGAINEAETANKGARDGLK